MRSPVLGYILIVIVLFIIAALVFLNCSWNIFTRGEVNGRDLNIDDPSFEDPDSLETLDLVEMEVGELLEDSLPPDSLPDP